MKKVFAMIFVLTLCIGLLAGCEITPAETVPTTTSEPAGTTAPTHETQPTGTEPAAYSFEGKTLDVCAGHSAAMDGTDLNRFIESTLGIDIRWVVRPMDGVAIYASRIPVPSLVFTTQGLSGGITTYGSYGAYVNFWEYQELMPNFFALFNDESNPEMVAYRQAYMASENKLYVAPVFLGGDVQRCGWMYREDIFRELGLEVPTDWDSFVEALRKLKAAYPDAHPFAMRSDSGTGLYAMGEFAQQFGVNFSVDAARDPYTENYYDPAVTEEYRNMIRCIRQLIDEGLMDAACLSWDITQLQKSFADGRSFITYDRAFRLNDLELAGQECDPAFSLAWFHNLPFFTDPDNSVPYQCREAGVKGYAWYVPAMCDDPELAIRYLDWLYSEEGSRILSWGIEGESYGVDAEGNKYYLEGFDTTYMARYQESGLVDFSALVSKYSPKCQAMILDTMEAAASGGWEKTPTNLAWNVQEQMLMDTYYQSWVDAKADYLVRSLSGEVDIDDDAVWDAYRESLNEFRVDQLLDAYNASYARFLERRKVI